MKKYKGGIYLYRKITFLHKHINRVMRTVNKLRLKRFINESVKRSIMESEMDDSLRERFEDLCIEDDCGKSRSSQRKLGELAAEAEASGNVALSDMIHDLANEEALKYAMECGSNGEVDEELYDELTDAFAHGGLEYNDMDIYPDDYDDYDFDNFNESRIRNRRMNRIINESIKRALRRKM